MFVRVLLAVWLGRAIRSLVVVRVAHVVTALLFALLGFLILTI